MRIVVEDQMDGSRREFNEILVEFLNVLDWDVKAREIYGDYNIVFDVEQLVILREINFNPRNVGKGEEGIINDMFVWFAADEVEHEILKVS